MHKTITALLVLIFAFFAIPKTQVLAKVMTNQNGTVTIAKSEVVNDDLFIGAQNAQLEGTVNGDVFIGAQTVTINGTVNGNLHVGAGTFNLGGIVKGNVYTGAQNVLVNGASISGSLLAGGENVNLDKETSIGGSILTGAGTLTVDSQVKRSVYAATGGLTIGSDAKIGKDVYYVSDKNQEQPNISSDSKIAGVIKKSEIQTPQGINVKTQIQTALSGVKFGATLTSLLGALIVGFIYLKLFNKHFTQTAKLISGSFWKSLCIGLLVSIVFIPGLILLLITIIGLPVAGLAVLLFILYWYLAKIVVGSAIGNWATKKFHWQSSTYGTFVFGLLIIYILKLVPVIGFLSSLTVFWVGLGALTLQMFSKSN